MIVVPDSVKQTVDRILAEYEDFYKRGITLGVTITVGDKKYSGIEATKYYVDSVKRLREVLDTQEGYLFEGNDEEVKKKIYLQITEYFDQLLGKALYRVTNQVSCQKQLGKALRAAKRRDDIRADAEDLIDFIKRSQYVSWGQDDEHIKHRIFKLVKTEEEFEKLVAKEKRGHAKELTEGKNNPYAGIRVAWQEILIWQQCKDMHIWREREKFFKKYSLSDDFSLEYAVFKFWHGLTETGVYYVYIPPKKETEVLAEEVTTE